MCDGRCNCATHKLGDCLKSSPSGLVGLAVGRAASIAAADPAALDDPVEILHINKQMLIFQKRFLILR